MLLANNITINKYGRVEVSTEIFPISFTPFTKTKAINIHAIAKAIRTFMLKPPKRSIEGVFSRTNLLKQLFVFFKKLIIYSKNSSAGVTAGKLT